MRWASQLFLKSRLLPLGLGLILTLGGLWPAVAAGSARLYFSPAASSVQAGQSLTINLWVDSKSEPMTAVEAYGTYDADKLELISIDTSGTPFDFVVETGGGDGSFKIVRVAMDDTSGDQLLARLTFRGLMAGVGSVALSENSQLSDPEGGLFDLERGSSSVTVTTGSSGGVVPSTSGFGMSVAPLYVGYTIVSFDVSTSKATKASIEYGTDADNLEFSSNSAKTSSTNHILSFREELIRPATTYFYRITAFSDSGSRVVSSVESVTTQGLKLFVQILDANKQPVKADVVIKETGQQLKSPESGEFTLENLTDGVLTFSVDTGWRRSSEHKVELDRQKIISAPVSRNGRTLIEQTLSTQSETIELAYAPARFTASTTARWVAIVLIVLIVLLVLSRLGARVYYRKNAARQVEAQAPTIVNPSVLPTDQTTEQPADWWRRKG